MKKPVSQFITKCGCIIQGVMKDESEIRRIFCPEHQIMARVHSFKREVDLNKPLGEKTKASIEQLKKEYQESICSKELRRDSK